jgi:hypothetical protein
MSFYDHRGRHIDLADAGKRGGEGSVHRITGDPTRVAKIYHAARLSSELHTKLRVMLEQAPSDPSLGASAALLRANGTRHRSIAWVDGLVYADRSARDLRGFTMPFVDTDEFRQAHVYYDPSDRLRLFGGDFTWRHLLVASHNLASAVAAVHGAGHRVGDLRETNLLVSSSALVTLIDCDSFQIRDRRTQDVYPTRVATGDYLPPELQGIDFRTNHPDRYHADLFALAVLVFRFLMLGAHPFQARGPGVADAPTTEAKIRKGVFAFEGRRRGVDPPEYAPAYDVVPSALRSLFSRAFVRGHGDPDARPKAAEWVTALAEEGKRLRSCGANANHVHAHDLRACPWCRMTPDPFPGRPMVVQQIALANAPAQVPESTRVEQLRAYARVALADGPVTEPEFWFLRKTGGELGLKSAVIDRAIDEESRRSGTSYAATPPAATAPATAPASPPVNGHTMSWRPSTVMQVARDRRKRASVKAVAPVVVAGASAGALAPVVAPVAVAVVLLPLVAALGEVLAAKTWRARAMLPMRFAVLVHQSLGHAARVYVPWAIVGAALSFVRPIPIDLLMRATAGAAVATLVLVSVIRLASATDAYGTRLRGGRDVIRRMLVGDSGRMRRAAYALWVVAVATSVAVAMNQAYWWPLARWR